MTRILCAINPVAIADDSLRFVSRTSKFILPAVSSVCPANNSNDAFGGLLVHSLEVISRDGCGIRDAREGEMGDLRVRKVTVRLTVKSRN